jgi:hypothetical protein
MKQFGEIIYNYTRKQAIEDGVLVDVSEWASPGGMIGGFKIPVAMTAQVWALVQAPDCGCEDTRGRAHDVLWMAQIAARRNLDVDRVTFTVLVGGNVVEVVLHVSPGDEGEPVATIMLPGED